MTTNEAFLHFCRKCTPCIKIMFIFLSKCIRTIYEFRVFITDNAPLYRFFTYRIFSAINEINDCTTLFIVEAMCFIYYGCNRTQEVHNLVYYSIRHRLIIRTNMEEQVCRYSRYILFIPFNASKVF